jgi:DNA polymerase-3 subunit gamma/tau
MAYYRTHRPTQFSEILGQPGVRNTLQGALSNNRVGHAYLFSGPRGTGKTSTARIFARAVCCTNLSKDSVGIEPCGVCEACTSILNGSATDVVEIDAASNRGIEDIRELREQAQYPPLHLRKRVYIIDEVHMLTTEAFNALLKTLEEPGSHILFILATTELHKVPATIRSRCQLLRFERGSEDSLVEKLSNIAQKEGISINEEALSLIAQHAQGGFRDAETLLEKLHNEHTSITPEVVRQSLGIIEATVVHDLVALMLAGTTAEALPLLRRSTMGLQSFDSITTALIEEVRRQIFELISSGKKVNAVYSYALDQLIEAFILQKSAPSPSVVLELAVLNISSYHSQEDIPRPIRHEAGIVAVPLPPAPPVVVTNRAAALVVEATPVPQASVPVVELSVEKMSDIRKAWKEMADEICRDNVFLGQVIKQSQFHTADQQTITVYVRYKFHADKLREKKNHLLVQQILKRLTDQDWQVIYEINEAIPRQKTVKKITTGLDDAAAVFGGPQ